MARGRKIRGRAWFVAGPDTIHDLRKPHAEEEEVAFEVVKRIELSKIEYVNFITDLYADREFLEENSALCSTGGTYKCLLVQRRGKADGILVIPYDECYVDYAAYYPGPYEEI